MLAPMGVSAHEKDADLDAASKRRGKRKELKEAQLEKKVKLAFDKEFAEAARQADKERRKESQKRRRDDTHAGSTPSPSKKICTEHPLEDGDDLEASQIVVHHEEEDGLPPDPVDVLCSYERKQGKKKSVPIWRKLEVVDYYEGLPASILQKEKATMAKFPETVKASGQVGRWQKAALKQNWRLLPIGFIEHAKESPNWVREGIPMPLPAQVSLPPPKGRKGGVFMPEKILIQFDRVLAARIHAIAGCPKKISEILRIKSVTDGLKSVAELYNARVDFLNKDIAKANAKVKLAFDNDEISANEALKQYIMEHPKATETPSRVLVDSFLSRFKWQKLKFNVPSGYLPLAHPRVTKWLSMYKSMMKEKKVHPLLRLNLDQIWRLRFRGSKETLHKGEDDVGKYSAKRLTKKQQNALASTWAQWAKNVVSEVDSVDFLTDQKKLSRRARKLVEQAPVHDCRFGYTTTTSGWANGDRGILICVFSEGSLPQVAP